MEFPCGLSLLHLRCNSSIAQKTRIVNTRIRYFSYSYTVYIFNVILCAVFTNRGDYMFYENFDNLCKDKNTSPSAVCIKIGLSKTTSSYWKISGKIPKRETLEKIAEYLGCSVDYLLGREEHKIGIDLGTTYSFDGQKITPEDIRSIKYEPIIIKASESDWAQILNRLSPESLVKLRDYTRFLLWLQDQDAANSLKSQK